MLAVFIHKTHRRIGLVKAHDQLALGEHIGQTGVFSNGSGAGDQHQRSEQDGKQFLHNRLSPLNTYTLLC